MTGRASAFSNERVIAQLNQHFVPVAIDINVVLHKRDKEGKLLRKIVEQGHYAGRTKPTATRQGLYISTANGDLLSSRNTTMANHVLGLIGRGLAAWEQLQSHSIEPYGSDFEPDKYYVARFPEGGIILRETMRDLPRTSVVRHETWRHNFDHVWLTAKEVQAFEPTQLKKGTAYEIDEMVVRRLAQFHFVDQVKGEANAYAKDEVLSAKLTATLVENVGSQWTIRLDGSAKCVKQPNGEVNPFTGSKVTQPRSVDLKIRGWLTYDSAKESLTTFDLLAFGSRSGAATYNFRFRDMGPEPIAFAFEMLPNEPKNKIRPKFITWQYFD